MEAMTKTWGPFSGRQLTTIICVVLVAIAFPVGAFAVTGSNAFITDAVTGKQAKVDGNGNLQSKDSHLKVDPSGNLRVATSYGNTTVDGKVTAAGQNPTDLYTAYAVTTESCLAFAPPPGSALIVTSVSETSNEETGVSLYRTPYGACAIGSESVRKNHSYLSARGERDVPFPSGLVIPDGQMLVAYGAIAGTNPAIHVTVNGYLRPNSDCPTAQDCLKGD